MDDLSNQQKAFILIEALEGTCNGLWSVADNLEIEINENITDIIDDHIFECNCCGWWSPISEMDNYEDWICYECAANT